MIKTVLKTAAAKKPITVDGDNGLKEHLNIDQDFNIDDQLFENIIDAVVDYTQKLTGRKFITQSWYYYLEDWPKEDYIILPFGQLQSVATIKYTDVDNSQSTWSSAEYIVETTSDPGRVWLEDGYTWPNENLYPSNPIEIDFTCGYGTDGDDVDKVAIQAMKLLAGEMYEHREVNIMGVSMIEHPMFKSLIDQVRLFEL